MYIKYKDSIQKAKKTDRVSETLFKNILKVEIQHKIM